MGNDIRQEGRLEYRESEIAVANNKRHILYITKVELGWLFE